jgi:hypothetical protein
MGLGIYNFFSYSISSKKIVLKVCLKEKILNAANIVSHSCPKYHGQMEPPKKQKYVGPVYIDGR